MKNNQQSTAIPYVIAVFALILTAIFSWSMLISPRVEAIKTNNQKVEQLKVQNASTEKKINDLNQIKQNLQPYVQKQTELAKSFPDSMEQQKLLDSWAQLASKNGVSIEATSFKQPIFLGQDDSQNTVSSQGSTSTEQQVQQTNVLEDPLAEFDMSLTIKGNLDSIKNFVNDLSKAERPVIVSEMNMTESDDKRIATITGEGILSAPLPKPEVKKS